ncbi:replication factor C, subunit RFC1 [Moesziomyces antarcticus T-34]|uniref:Replication factor C, subunit RFC1 n=1 Tax=Pseudozyma antarctica (strain T-34) TaxID=1151754 RepID=M9M0N0_PSEA3|nr:replication factor C, subunit RFC1 [Moesziomyces antarcticus T-34]
MRQATLPWAPPTPAPPPFHRHATHDTPVQQQAAYTVPNEEQIDPALLDADTVIDVSTPTPPPTQPEVATRQAQDMAACTDAPADARPLHPFFTAPTPAMDDEEEGDGRRTRSSRAKAPVSYREDLKAVLRADAAHEAARLKDEKRQAAHQAQAERRSRPAKTKPKADFEIVETRVAPAPASKRAEQPKPLSLAVKGTSSEAATAHPFFAKKAKPAPTTPSKDSAEDGGEASSGSKHTAGAPAAWSLFSAPRQPARRPTKPVHAPWPSQHDTHLVGWREKERQAIDKARIGLEAFREQYSSRTPHTPVVSTWHAAPDFVRSLNDHRPRPASEGMSLTGDLDAFDSVDDYTAQHVDMSRLTLPTRAVEAAEGQLCASDDEWDDFIVDDDEQEAEPPRELDDEQCFGRFGRIQTALAEPNAGGDSPAPSAPGWESLEQLTNCMVLAGPSGSGKTACVYACAAQLGYEVFELYPGMGKRSGREMLACVGDLARNHMVSSGGIGGGASLKPTAATSVRQSLILIEEADVLFDEDKGFWSAVVELVGQSKRPVVVVCNEPDLVPLHDLPVQEVLEFQKPAAAIVAPWLQTVAARAGRWLSADAVQRWLGQAEVDVRQALMQLQFGLGVPPKQTVVDTVKGMVEEGADVRAVAKAAESSSWADVVEGSAGIEEWGDVGVELHPTRQWGSWTQLVPQPRGSVPLRHSGTDDYRAALDQIHGAKSAATVRIPVEEREVDSTVDRLWTMVRPVLSRSAVQTDTAIVLDYAPMVRLMAIVDDDLAAIHRDLHAAAAPLEPAPARGRSTRNSARLTSWLASDDYERWLLLGPQEVQIAKQTALSFEPVQ